MAETAREILVSDQWLLKRSYSDEYFVEAITKALRLERSKVIEECIAVLRQVKKEQKPTQRVLILVQERFSALKEGDGK